MSDHLKAIFNDIAAAANVPTEKAYPVFEKWLEIGFNENGPCDVAELANNLLQWLYPWEY